MVKRLLALALGAALLAPAAAQAKDSLVEVSVRDQAALNRLVGSGLDVGGVGSKSARVVLHSSRDAATLRELGYLSRVLTSDLGTVNARSRKAEAAKARRLKQNPELASPLPTGRVSYRTIDEINDELRKLAREYPDEVELFRLPHRSLLGRRIFGVKISHDVEEESGKPVYLLTGVHHAREWPTAEFTMEFAWDVLENDGKDERITSLLEKGKLIVVPVVNPDGYDMSRSRIIEQKRKNCRIQAGAIPTFDQCADQANEDLGVDLNRNYGSFWGGPGSSADPTASNHRGPAPWSEPEIQNMRELSASQQVTVAINNHTPDERVLRAPSASNEPRPVADETMYQALAEDLGRDLGWPAGPWTDIYYEATGTAEETAYYAAGTLAFTTEATPRHEGLERFHPPYPRVIEQYFGTGFYANSSIRNAFLTAFDAAVDPARHAVITGTATRGAELTISKRFTMDTSPFSEAPGEPAMPTPFEMELESTLTVPRSGRFTWHVNPSLRPSQYLSTHIRESWTVSCGWGRRHATREVPVRLGRGGAAEIDMRGCPR